MQKRILTILACLLVAINLFAFSACGYVEGSFYSLEEAYENGWLTQEELLSIAYYNQGTLENEDLLGENYVPMPLTPSEIDEKTEKAIIKTYFAELLEEAPSNVTIYIEDAYVAKYYGTYNDCVIVKMAHEEVKYMQVVTYEAAGDVTFYYGVPNHLRVWRKIN